MALFEIYIDESYTDDGYPAVLVVGGYIFQSEAAKQLTCEWTNVLEEFNVPFFHMKDVASGNDVFKHLYDDQRDQLARKMFGIIKQHAQSGFAVAINPKRSWHVPPFPDGPYAFAFDQCVSWIATQLQARHSNAECLFIFEKGHKQGPSALKVLTQNAESSIYERIRNAKCGFDTKRNCCLLQTADILAWHFR